MKSHTNRQRPKGPPIHRPCLDSLQIPSKPGIFLPKSCMPKLCAMKYPECNCDQDFCMIDIGSSSTSCRGPSSLCHGIRRDNKNDDCLGPCRKQDDGCKNVEECEFDVPFSRSSSVNREQRSGGESTAINEETANSSCPMSHSPSVADQSINTTPDYRTTQTPVEEFPNLSTKGSVKICQNRQPLTNGSLYREIIRKPSNLTKSSPNVQNATSYLNIENCETDQNNQFNNISLQGETRYLGTRNNLRRLPNSADAPQASRSSDVNKTPPYLENIKHDSHEPENNLYETNPRRRPDCYQQNFQPTLSRQPSEELQYFTKRQKFNDQQRNIIQSSRTNLKNKNMGSIDPQTSHLDSDYHNFKKNLGSKGFIQGENATVLGTSTPLHAATDLASPTNEPSQYTLNPNAPRYICDKCHETFRRTSDEGILYSNSKAYIADDREYQGHIHTGLASSSGLSRGRSNVLNTADNPRIINATDLNSCCIRDTSQETGSQFLTPSRRSTFMSPHLKNMLPSNGNFQGMSNESSRNHSTCCETIDPRSMNKVHIPQLHSNINVSSSQQMGSKKQSSHGNSKLYLPSFKEKSGTHNFELKKGTKNVADCCSHGISKFIRNEPQHQQIKNNPNIDCVCSDGINGIQCEKQVPCVHEVGATSCASTSCTVNQISGCCCRYPPAFKQFGCTGNINGSCNCSDDH